MRRKLFPLILALCILLSGCMAQVNKISINEDFSGTVIAKVGYTEEAINLISEIMVENGVEPLDLSEMVVFTYNGVEYFGVNETYEFANIEELNQLIVSDDSNSIEFSECADGSVALVVTTTAEVDVGTYDDSAEVDEETRSELEALAESMVMVFEVEFPTDIEQTEGITTDSVKIDGNSLFIDFIGLSQEISGEQEVFIFAKPGSTDAPTLADDLKFIDVTRNDWFYKQVAAMVDIGLFNGKTEDKFCPDDTMTKAEFVTVVARMIYDETELASYEKAANIWWDKYYNACVEEGIFTEIQLPRIGLDEGMSRQEMAMVSYGLLKKIEFDSEISYDTEAISKVIPDWQQIDADILQQAARCYAEGIICGADNIGSFKPQGTLTRAEASTVLYRIIDINARVINDELYYYSAE